jgi:hypothetical protein
MAPGKRPLEKSRKTTRWTWRAGRRETERVSVYQSPIGTSENRYVFFFKLTLPVLWWFFFDRLYKRKSFIEIKYFRQDSLDFLKHTKMTCIDAPQPFPASTCVSKVILAFYKWKLKWTGELSVSQVRCQCHKSDFSGYNKKDFRVGRQVRFRFF